MLTLYSTSALAQLPNNIGFEKGTFEGWECSIGQRSVMAGDIMSPPNGAVYNRHTLLDTNSKSQVDKYGGFPVLCPNGSIYSIRLGNDEPMGQMQRVAYTY